MGGCLMSDRDMNIALPDLSQLLSRPIAFQRPYAVIAGSAAGGLFLSQAVYWSDRSQHEGGWFYTSQDEWHEQTMLKRSEQERARKELKKAGVLEEIRKGNPARLWYRVNKNQLNLLLYKTIEKQQFAESDNQECRIQQTRMQDSTNCPESRLSEPALDQEKNQENQQIAESDNQDFLQEKQQFAESDNQDCRIRQSRLQDPADSLTENTTESNTDISDTDSDDAHESPDGVPGVFGSHLILDCHPYLYWFLRFMEDKHSKGSASTQTFAERLGQFGLEGGYCQETLNNFLTAQRASVDRFLMQPDHSADEVSVWHELIQDWDDNAHGFIQEADSCLESHRESLLARWAA